MIWAVLTGNTRTVAALMHAHHVVKRVILPTTALQSAVQAFAWAKSLQKIAPVEGVMAASVVPPVDGNIRKAIQKTFGKAPLFVTAKSLLGVGVKVKKPSQVGADRLANAVAAKELYGAPAIVVDYGTGTTFDVVDSQGNYCGGAILPGLGISMRALHDYTAKIPLVQFEKINYAIGRSTEEAVRSGIYHGAIGTTRELLARIRKELGVKAPAIATGGYCGVFRDTNLFQQIEADLTLKGITMIWRKTHA